MKIYAVCAAILSLPLAAFGQENVTALPRTGQFTKHLTPNEVDEWTFDGEKDETVIARVATKDFDSILGLYEKSAAEEKLLFPEVDDPGTDSHFSFRLPKKGTYSIHVHAFKFKGGGNYELDVRRFQAAPLELGKRCVGTFDRQGTAHYYFHGTRDRILTADVMGASNGALRMLGPNGEELHDWEGAVTIEQDGEHYLVVNGRPEARFEIVVREAQRKDLVEGKELAGQLSKGQMDVWSFEGKPGDFRLIELQKKGDVSARLIYSPVEKNREKRLDQAEDRPEVSFLPVASTGGHMRFAAFLGRKGRYQLQVLARSAIMYGLQSNDPSTSLQKGQDVDGNLPLGGAVYYRFHAEPGQLIQARLGSRKFVPLLQLYDSRGNLVAKSEADTDDLESRITHMVVRGDVYRLQVSSQGDGGGGDFHLAIREIKLKELALGQRSRGALENGNTDFWSYTGKEGQTVFLNVRSRDWEPVVCLRSPDGIELQRGEQGGDGVGSLLAVKLPKSGRYTVWISSRRGAGDYVVRMIDGD